MREAEKAPKRIYRYCVIRVRMPDGSILQGVLSLPLFTASIDSHLSVSVCLSVYLSVYLSVQAHLGRGRQLETLRSLSAP